MAAQEVVVLPELACGEPFFFLTGPAAVKRVLTEEPTLLGNQENPPKLSQPIPGRCLYVEAKRNPGGDMASNTRIPKAELTGIYGAMVKRMSRKMFGDVPEPVEVAWHNRKVLNFFFSLGRKAQKWDQRATLVLHTPWACASMLC